MQSGVVTDRNGIFTIESSEVYRRGNVVSFKVKATVKPGKESQPWNTHLLLPSFAAPGYFAPCYGDYYGPDFGLKPLPACAVTTSGSLQTNIAMKEGWTVDYRGTYIIK